MKIQSLGSVQMESQGEAKNISGASQQNSLADLSETIEVDGDLF